MNRFAVSRRLFLLSSAASVLPRAGLANTQPWKAQFIGGGFDGAKYALALHVQMEPNWKTYWRVPGAGGIPPSIQITGQNLLSFRVDLPAPKRIPGEEGDSIGYKDEVLFPIEILPLDVMKPLTLQANAFIGVCDTICIPVPIEQALDLQPIAASNASDALIAVWHKKLPVLSPDLPILSATLENQVLNLAIKKTWQDIFVEGPPQLYFSAPTFVAQNASFSINGLKNSQDLTGQSIRVTLIDGDVALEQNLVVV